ncbi:MAG: hypothetical protein GF418_07220 [Chitinivibrionales bacterium]|nr:hypothetical protein [Chitinivibrionales bacterium]MBD3395402.1 hypothetical protein [Chitinivibrionales bacterium]
MKKTLVLFIGIAFALGMPARGADYFPLAEGNVWDHDVQGLVEGVLQDMGTATWTITGQTVHDGNPCFVVEVLGRYELAPGLTLTDTSEIYLIDDGNDVYVTTDLQSPTAAVKAGQHSYEGGETWNAAGTDVTVETASTETVPAGEFNGCFAVNSADETVGLFAPDVGPLKMRLEKDGNTLFFTLRDFDVSPPLAICCPVPREGSRASGLFTADNNSRTVHFDLGDRRRGTLSVFRPDGRLVRQHEIAGMGILNVDNRSISSGNVLLRLELDGKSYTGRMTLTK